ncbi:hypothetical protein GIB67_021280 [Kingdonia uniflora]|uniref:Alpha 1,4-glycosyltransferase domain-containing protein n=1 Tax=Kingdonia uniflora TaxID=39325 RepID=A0A7J7LG30_9MAGN|nr:hypothetical protein GIB67_021280 [Kingdonia uniflora]
MEDNISKYPLCPFRKLKRSLLALFCFPTSLFALLLLLLLSYNGASIFCIKVPSFLPKTPETFSPEKKFSPENKFVRKPTKSGSNVMFAVKEEIPVSKLQIKLPLLEKSNLLMRRGKFNVKSFVGPTLKSKLFSQRLKEFFNGVGSSSSCKVRFFMTWISSVESFDFRELFTIESVFKSHPNACLVILSSSLDSTRGSELLEPFRGKGFRIFAISPDFDYLFKNTFAEAWFDRLKKGDVDPGDVSLGQNLSNLVRLSVLYKFGGIYIDTDVIVLKNFAGLRNVIGAQTMDLESGNWSRLNNAVMIFDKKHPLLFKFIQEFALTFNGNKWGHNGPYLVSRVVSRVTGRPGFNFTVLPPPAFYPIDWRRIQSLFHAPRAGLQSKWVSSKLKHIRKESFALHLWNKHSRNLTVEEGSIIGRIMLDCCIFCNSSVSAL